MEQLDISTSEASGLTLTATGLPVAQPSPSLPLPLTPTWETLQVSYRYKDMRTISCMLLLYKRYCYIRECIIASL